MLLRKHFAKAFSLPLVAFVLLSAGSEALAQTTTFTYQGRLQDTGTPANGNYDLQLTLWDAASGGTQQPQPSPVTVTRASVLVTGGVFTVQLDFGASAFPGADRFLETGVRPAGNGAFTILSPRQQITSTPYALRSLTATSADTLSAVCNGCVTGATIPAGQVVKSLNNLFDSVTLAAGSNITITPAGNTLTLASTGGGSGLSSVAHNATLSGDGTSGLPLSVAAPLQLSGAASLGSYILSVSNTGFGNGLSVSANVAGINSTALNYGVLGTGTGSAGVGVYGYGTSGSGTGVAGSATSGTGVAGTATTGTGVSGVSTTGIGVIGQNTSGGIGVSGSSTSGHGVSGSSGGSASNASGVSGTNTGGGWGVSGFSNGFAGVLGFGNSNSSNGVYGWVNNLNNNASGVYGRHEGGGNGVTGSSASGYGVYGVTASSTLAGGYFRNAVAGGIALIAAGPAQVNILQIMGGSDLAEHFDVVAEAKPGMVVTIDPDQPGQLSIARSAYNRRVAGVISGANKLAAGMVLSDLPGSKNSLPVALSGRVWVYCDATRSAIEPGDLLTTSNIPGHAMKVTNHARAQGAIIGKAMTSLRSGRGLVLVLVTLQ